MEKENLTTKIIKISFGILGTILLIILISQYISMAQLSKKNENLQAQLISLNEQKDELSKEKNDIENNYDDYVTDFSRDNYNYVAGGEILINKK